jgi:hypothetical protein
MTVRLAGRLSKGDVPEKIGGSCNMMEVPRISGGRTDKVLDFGELVFRMQHLSQAQIRGRSVI